MSLNVPVIATRIGGIPEVLKDGHGGYLVAPDDPIELAQRIIEISQDDSLQSRLGAWVANALNNILLQQKWRRHMRLCCNEKCGTNGL